MSFTTFQHCTLHARTQARTPRLRMTVFQPPFLQQRLLKVIKIRWVLTGSVKGEGKCMKHKAHAWSVGCRYR